mmetsp:Transcript_35625/g.105817  ORF Transcript_35625/g.105817 Transcript_35625/m.105817 type:complete len:252 (+) Transcript_35625:314-1069(+)
MYSHAQRFRFDLNLHVLFRRLAGEPERDLDLVSVLGPAVASATATLLLGAGRRSTAVAAAPASASAGALGPCGATAPNPAPRQAAQQRAQVHPAGAIAAPVLREVGHPALEPARALRGAGSTVGLPELLELLAKLIRLMVVSTSIELLLNELISQLHRLRQRVACTLRHGDVGGLEAPVAEGVGRAGGEVDLLAHGGDRGVPGHTHACDVVLGILCNCLVADCTCCGTRVLELLEMGTNEFRDFGVGEVAL